MYSVRSRTGKIVRRFPTRRQAEVFVRIHSAAKSPRRPAFPPFLAEVITAFDTAVAGRPMEYGLDREGRATILRPDAYEEVGKIAAAFRANVLKAAKLLGAVAAGDETKHPSAVRARERAELEARFLRDHPQVRDATDTIIKRLYEEGRRAVEAGTEARIHMRNQEIVAAREREREAKEEERRRDPALYAYRQELKRRGR